MVAQPRRGRPEIGTPALRHMRVWGYVLAIAQTGSIRQAAERLNIAPSALQRRLRDVEEDLGFDLFERSAGGVRLTAAGEIFLGWIRRQGAELERARQQMDALRGLRRGHVRIAASQALAVDFLPRAIATFRARYPLITFECAILGHDEAAARLLAHEADLVLAFGLPQRPEILALMSIGQRLCALMAQTHTLATRRPLRLRDCLAFPLALPGAAFGARRLLDEWAARRSLDIPVAVESNSFELLRHHVRNSDAVTFQIEIGATPGPAMPGLAAIAIDDRDMAHGPLVLAQLRGRPLHVAAASFAEHVGRALDEGRTTPMLDMEITPPG